MTWTKPLTELVNVGQSTHVRSYPCPFLWRYDDRSIHSINIVNTFPLRFTILPRWLWPSRFYCDHTCHCLVMGYGSYFKSTKLRHAVTDHACGTNTTKWSVSSADSRPDLSIMKQGKSVINKTHGGNRGFIKRCAEFLFDGLRSFPLLFIWSSMRDPRCKFMLTFITYPLSATVSRKNPPH